MYNSDAQWRGAVSHADFTLLIRERKPFYVNTCAASVGTCEFACWHLGETNLRFVSSKMFVYFPKSTAFVERWGLLSEGCIEELREGWAFETRVFKTFFSPQYRRRAAFHATRGGFVIKGSMILRKIPAGRRTLLALVSFGVKSILSDSLWLHTYIRCYYGDVMSVKRQRIVFPNCTVRVGASSFDENKRNVSTSRFHRGRSCVSFPPCRLSRCPHCPRPCRATWRPSSHCCPPKNSATREGWCRSSAGRAGSAHSCRRAWKGEPC